MILFSFSTWVLRTSNYVYVHPKTRLHYINKTRHQIVDNGRNKVRSLYWHNKVEHVPKLLSKALTIDLN